MKTVGITDYGMGNIRSIEGALSYLGFSSVRVSEASDLHRIDALILPGVGGFPRAMSRLRKNGLVDPIVDWAKEGRRLVGICLGMQLLFQKSDEIAPTEGLGLLQGHVKLLDSNDSHSFVARLPNMGWRELRSMVGSSGDNGFAEHVAMHHERGLWMYFAHSYGIREDGGSTTLSVLDYDSVAYVAIVQEDNVIGFQGHPELSGVHGLELLKASLA